MKLWQHREESPEITPLIPENKTSDRAVVIFPGGGYLLRAEHEGAGYARFLNKHGITAFVVDYRVAPATFPLPLLDARRAVRLVRANAALFGIDPQQVAVMGSSAGGHLAAMTSTYLSPIDGEGVDEIDEQPFLPDAQILCYPVICAPADDNVAHVGSYRALLGEERFADCAAYDPSQLVSASTPPAFMWHTASDNTVNVINSYRYATALRQHDIDVEMHIFPHGRHGLGLCEQEEPHTAQWANLLLNWLAYTDK